MNDEKLRRYHRLYDFTTEEEQVHHNIIIIITLNYFVKKQFIEQLYSLVSKVIISNIVLFKIHSGTDKIDLVGMQQTLHKV